MSRETKPTPQEQNPQRGGSYIRQADGSLELVEATKPAKPDLNREPATPATDTPSEE
jgi:hypothetical protein